MSILPAKPAPSWALVLAFAIMYVAWGTTYLAIQIGVRDEQLPPFLFAGTRIVVAGLILLSVQALRRKPLR
jgi:drug/metabolite transporter (DMT)-like permease